VWNQRLQIQGMNNVEVLEDIAKKCEKYGLSIIAVQRYLAASRSSLGKKLYVKALELSKKAESIFKKVSADTDNRKEFAGVECSLYAHAGKLRHDMRSEKGIKGLKKDLQLTESYLLQSIAPACSLVDNADGKGARTLSIDNILSIHTLSSIYEEKYRQIVSDKSKQHLREPSTNEFLHRYLHVLEQSLLSLSTSIDLVIRDEADLNVEIISFEDLVGYFITLKENFQLIGTSLAQSDFVAERYTQASNIYKSIIKNYSKLREILRQEKLIMKRGKGGKQKREKPKRQLSKIPCGLFFWYAHALAGTEIDVESNIKSNYRFTDSKDKILQATRSLAYGLTKCDDDADDDDINNSMGGNKLQSENARKMASGNIDDLTEFLNEKFRVNVQDLERDLSDVKLETLFE
jgi:hypothetical protein